MLASYCRAISFFTPWYIVRITELVNHPQGAFLEAFSYVASEQNIWLVVGYREASLLNLKTYTLDLLETSNKSDFAWKVILSFIPWDHDKVFCLFPHFRPRSFSVRSGDSSPGGFKKYPSLVLLLIPYSILLLKFPTPSILFPSLFLCLLSWGKTKLGQFPDSWPDGVSGGYRMTDNLLFCLKV